MGGSVDVENQNGSIEVHAADAKECRRTTLRTSFGAIRFVLPANPDFRVEARTSFGRIHSDVPIATTDREADRPTRSSRSGRLRPLPAHLTDSNGSIEIVRRK